MRACTGAYNCIFAGGRESQASRSRDRYPRLLRLHMRVRSTDVADVLPTEKDLVTAVIANNASALRRLLHSGRTPSSGVLTLACSFSRLACVRVLVDAGAPTDVPSTAFGPAFEGDTALNHALVTGRGDRFPADEHSARPR